MEFLLDSANLPFTISLGLMLSIGLLEGITTLLGAGLSNFIDSLLPDVDLDVDMSGGAAVDAADALSRILGWFHIGRVPILVLMVIFLFMFGIAGLILQAIFENTVGMLLPGFIAVTVALLVSIPCVRIAGGVLARIMPRDETDAVSETTFVGRIARITLGTASHGKPAQAKLHDEHGKSHYIMAEPDKPRESLETGQDVVIVRQNGAVFYAIRFDEPDD